MRISTSEFLLGSLNTMLTQETTVNQLNEEISSGQSLTDPTTNPAGAGLVLNLSDEINHLTFDNNNANAATQSIQSGISVLQQVTTVLNQVRQTAAQAANGTTTAADRTSFVNVVQDALQELVQLANTQGADGSYLFSGSKAATTPFSQLSNGQVIYDGDGGRNQVEIAPNLDVPVSLSGQSIFMDIPNGNGSFSVAASGSNTGGAVAIPASVTSASQVAAERLAGSQYEVSFAGSGSSLTYSVSSGTGAPGSAGFAASSGVVASGAFTAGSDVQFAGMDVQFQGAPAAGDAFTIAPSQNTSIFATVQTLVSALEIPQSGPGQSALAQQKIQSVLGNLDQGQTSILLAQASFGANLSEVQTVQGQNTTLSTNAKTQLSATQSADLPQVMANYSEGVTALQAAQEAFARIQGLTLFSVIGH